MQIGDFKIISSQICSTLYTKSTTKSENQKQDANCH